MKKPSVEMQQIWARADDDGPERTIIAITGPWQDDEGNTFALVSTSFSGKAEESAIVSIGAQDAAETARELLKRSGADQYVVLDVQDAEYFEETA